LLFPTIPPKDLTTGDEEADEAIEPLLCKLVSFMASSVLYLYPISIFETAGTFIVFELP